MITVIMLAEGLLAPRPWKSKVPLGCTEKDRGRSMKGCNMVTEKIQNVVKGNLSEVLAHCFPMLPISPLNSSTGAKCLQECAGGGTWSLPALGLL